MNFSKDPKRLEKVFFVGIFVKNCIDFQFSMKFKKSSILPKKNRDSEFEFS